MAAPETLPPVLLCDATWYGTLAAVWDLGSRGVPVTVASDAVAAPARWSRYATRVERCPSAKDAERFPRWLLEFGERNPGHVLYPTSDDVAWYVAQHREALARHYRLFTPGLDGLARLLDKGQLALDGRAAGLEVPDTWCPEDEAALVKLSGELKYPVFLKPRTQALAAGKGKGLRVETPEKLLAGWREACAGARYDAGVARLFPGVNRPVVQACAPRTERIYTVDGFIDETGALYAALACTKVLQRPRSAGPGVVFEPSPLVPALRDGLQRLCRATGFRGVFDAEFVETGDARLFIDFNPRFYNHMAFETDRGLPLPWMAYLAARGERAALAEVVAQANAAQPVDRAYVHRLPTQVMLWLQGLAGSMSREERRGWSRWIRSYRGRTTDPACGARDRAPAAAALAMELVAFARHPRSYLRHLAQPPV